MKKLGALLIALMITITGYSQFGVTGGYQVISSDAWQMAIAETQGLTLSNNRITKGWSAGIDYWFRLKNKRIEFLPELRANQTKFIVAAAIGNGNTGEVQEFKLDIDNYSFNFNTHIYPFDFDGDCDCPVWSKEGPSFSKGFFIRISPSVGYWKVEEDYIDFSGTNADWHTSIGVGTGMDIGLSDLLTITPIIEHRWHSGEVITGLSEEAETYTNWFAGIRLGVRLDD